MILKDLLRKDLSELKPYHAEEKKYRLKLDANESPYDLPDSVKKELTDFIYEGLSANIYPDTDSNSLRDKLAVFWGLKRSNFLVGNGSDQVIQIILNTVINRGDAVIMPVPSFVMFKIATLVAGGMPVEVPLIEMEDRFEYDIDAFLDEAKKSNSKLMFLCTPNNPTGNCLTEDRIMYVLDRFDGLVVVDEAYGEFGFGTMLPYINKYQNLIVLKTFSKAYGIAGLRIGYSVCNQKLNEYFYKVKPPYNINRFSQYLAKIMLDNHDHVQKVVASLKNERKFLLENLRALDGVKVFDSKANFILLKVKNSEKIACMLEDKGILVRYFKNEPLLKECIRVTVGKHDDNLTFIEEFKKVLSEVGL